MNLEMSKFFTKYKMKDFNRCKTIQSAYTLFEKLQDDICAVSKFLNPNPLQSNKLNKMKWRKCTKID